MIKRAPLRVLFNSTIGILLLFSMAPASAQEREEPEEPPRFIESLIISDRRPSELYFRNLEGEFRIFRIGFQRSGGVNRIPPEDSLVLYRKLEGEVEPETPPYKVVKELKLPTGDQPLLLVFFQNKQRQLQHRFLDAGPDAFGAMEVQLINLSETLPVIAALGEKRYDLKPGTEIKTSESISKEERFSFQYGSRQPSGQTYVSPETRLQIPFENMRLRIFFAAVERTVQTSEGLKTEMVLRDARVFERVEP